MLGRYASTAKIQALRLELIRAGLLARDEPHEAGSQVRARVA
jgi:hypothetical protein